MPGKPATSPARELTEETGCVPGQLSYRGEMAHDAQPHHLAGALLENFRPVLIQLASVPRGRRRLVSWAGVMVTGNGRATVSEAVVTATVA